MASEESLPNGARTGRLAIVADDPWRTLLGLARPYRLKFAVVAFLAGLATTAQLIEPMIYRAAVNDVAGLFVERAAERARRSAEQPADRAAERRAKRPDSGAGSGRRPAERPAQPERNQPGGPLKPKLTALEPRGRPVDFALQPIAEHPATPAVHASPDVKQHAQSHRPKVRLKKKQKATREPHRRGHVAPRTVDQMFTTLLWAVGLLFVANLAAHVFALAADNASEAVANRIEEDVIHATFGHALRLPLAYLARRASGALAKQIDQSDQVSPIITAFAKDILPEAMLVVGIIAIMLTQSPKLTLVALITLPAYLLVARRSARRLESNIQAYYTLWEEVSARIQDAVAAVKTVKLSGAEEREVARLRGASNVAYASYLERNKIANRYLFWQAFLSQLGKALVLGYGGWKVLQRQLTPGDVVMYVAYLDKLYDPIDSLTSLAKNLQAHAASLRRALRLLETKGEESTGRPLRYGPGRVELRDVHFAYQPGREVLHGVSLVLEAGKVTALVGPSGSGKTTIVDLLLRLYEPTSGAILLDGQPLADLAPPSVRREVCVVAADGAVFRGTLADNIRYRQPNATDEEVHSAAVAAGLKRTLERLPEGLDTEVGERGVGLSLGERQRLQIARVLVAEPRVLILDEATGNLDYATELEVKQSLEAVRRSRTTLIIAHRFSMVRDADRVIVLDGGRVVESGTVDELLASGGWFARLARDGGTLRPVSAARRSLVPPGSAEIA
jgi:ABC-type multidrug transport system fused ATPase/permease subunit